MIVTSRIMVEYLKKVSCMWFVYIVRCRDDSLYTGSTTDVKRRVKEHNGIDPSGARYTRMKRPVALVYSEAVATRKEAFIREAEIKKLSHTHKELLIGSRSM